MDALSLTTVSPHPHGNRITFRTAVSRFLGELPYMRRQDGKLLKEGTRNWYRYELDRLIKIKGDWGVMGDIPMLDVTAEHMASWPNTASFGEVTRRLYNWLGLPKPRGFVVPRKRRRERTVTRSEFARLLRHTRSARWIFWFGFDSGGRSVEFRELKWYEVKLKARAIVQEEFKADWLRKDGTGRRIIALSPMATRILALWKRQRNPAPDDHVFLNWRGEPWTCGAIRQAMRKACARAGLEPLDGGERIVRYSLRHTAIDELAGNMLKQGTYDITLVADLAGHADLQTTRRYMHRKESHLVEGRDRFMTRVRAPKSQSV